MATSLIGSVLTAEKAGMRHVQTALEVTEMESSSKGSLQPVNMGLNQLLARGFEELEEDWKSKR